jgi:glycosyltransferase XagB
MDWNSQGPPAGTPVGETVANVSFDRPWLRVVGARKPLPPELDFVANAAISEERLLAATRTAPAGVGPLDVLLGEGALTEDGYYRALARHLGCEYYLGEPAFASHFDAPKALRSGVAPIEGNFGSARAVIAPRGGSVARLIEQSSFGRLSPKSFAIASPQQFAALIRLRCGEAVLGEALGRLPWSLSARTGATVAQIAVAGLVAASAVALAAASPQALETGLFVGLWFAFLASITLRSIATVADGAVDRPRLRSDDELPLYTVVAAVYRESSVVPDLVAALDALDYPKSKLDIKIVVEQRDRETLATLMDLRLPARYEIVVAPPGEPSTKPRALNIALSAARGEFLVVYDAEDAPAPDQLRLAASRFAAEPDVDCLQARLTIRNSDDSWISKLFSVEYAALFDLINPGLCALGLPIALGGTSNHFRVDCLQRVGGWDEWNVTEDADLGVRLARFGCRIDRLDSDTSEEAPHELGNWFRQRVRWQKGWMQTCMVHSRDPRGFLADLGGSRGAATLILILGAVVGALFWPVFAFDTIRRAFAAGDGMSAWREAIDVFTYVLALGGIWATVVPVLVAAKQRGLGLTGRMLALLPVYYLMVSAAAWTAIFDLALRPHYWAKTEHGRALPRSVRLPPTIAIGSR